MIKNIEQFHNWLNELHFKKKNTLKRMKRAIELLGNPERSYDIVQIGGTNGKGSTTLYTSEILKQYGLKVGTFTSPFMEVFNDRIRVNGDFISDKDLIEIANEVKPIVEVVQQEQNDRLNFFEVLTLVAAVYFKRQKVDIAIFEVGIGGRFDATTVFTPVATAITNVGLDHEDTLGDTVEKIAYQKAGIFKKGVPVFTRETKASVLDVFEKERLLVGTVVEYGASVEDLEITKDNKLKFSVLGEQYELDTTAVYQVENLLLARNIAVYILNFKKIDVLAVNLIKGVEQIALTGRFEVINTNPKIIFDGAHNFDGIKKFVKTLKSSYDDVVVIYASKTRSNIKQIIDELGKVANDFVFTTLKFDSFCKTAKLLELADGYNCYGIDNYKEALDKALKIADGKTIVVTGTIYLRSLIVNQLNNLN